MPNAQKRDTRREMIEPGHFALVHSGKSAIYERVRAVVRIDDDGKMEKIASEGVIEMIGLSGQIDDLVNRYNDGIRYF